MIKKIIGFLILIIPLFFGFATIKAIVNMPETNRKLKDATLVLDGLCHKENEGKRVAAVFHFDTFEDTEDADMNIRFHSPFIHRYVQVLRYDGREYRWEEVGSYTDNHIKDAAFIGTAQKDESLIIDDSLLISIGASKQAVKKHIYEQDFKRLENEFYVVDYNTQTWFSQAPSWLMEDSDKGTTPFDEYYEYEGSLRIRYNIIEPDKNESVTVMGIQLGNVLIKDQNLDAYPIFDGDSLEEISQESYRNLILGILVAASLYLPLAYYGIRMFMGK